MAEDADEPPQYTRYRARPRLPALSKGGSSPGAPLTRGPGRLPPGPSRGDRTRAGGRVGPSAGWRKWATPKRIALSLLGLVIGWIALSLVAFLISSHFERTS